MASQAAEAKRGNTVAQELPPAYEETAAYPYDQQPHPTDPMLRETANRYYDEDSDDDFDASRYQQGVGNPLQGPQQTPHRVQVHNEGYPSRQRHPTQEEQENVENRNRQYPAAPKYEDISQQGRQPTQRQNYSASAAASNLPPQGSYGLSSQRSYEPPPQRSYPSQQNQQPGYSTGQARPRDPPRGYIPPRPTVSNGPYYHDGVSNYNQPSPYFTEDGKLKPYQNPKRFGVESNANKAAPQQRQGSQPMDTSVSNGAYGQPTQEFIDAQEAAEFGFNPNRAEDYMCCSILNCLFCNMIAGLIAIVLSFVVQQENAAMNYTTARRFSRATLIVNILGPVTAIVTVIIILLTGLNSF